MLPSVAAPRGGLGSGATGPVPRLVLGAALNVLSAAR